jgi:hypothetical protein
MPLIGVDLSNVPGEVREEMRRIWQDEHHAAVHRALARQEVLARFYHEHPPAWSDGIGPQTMAIDPVLLNCWRMMLGEETDDEECMKWLAKKQGGVMVKAVSPKTQVGYSAPPSNRKFRKVYAAE